MDLPDLPASPSSDDPIRVRAKRELRKRMRALRAAIPASAIAERSAAIVNAVLAHESWAAARTVALFASMPEEVQTGALVAAARQSGKRVALPVVTDEPVLTFRAPYDPGSERQLVTSDYGIPEPGPDSPVIDPAEIDFILVPALALDLRGHRIGYGAGYYDHTLPLATRAVRVAVAFEFQLIAEVPERAGDVPAHWIITDRRVLRAEAMETAPWSIPADR